MLLQHCDDVLPEPAPCDNSISCDANVVGDKGQTDRPYMEDNVSREGGVRTADGKTHNSSRHVPKHHVKNWPGHREGSIRCKSWDCVTKSPDAHCSKSTMRSPQPHLITQLLLGARRKDCDDQARCADLSLQIRKDCRSWKISR
jgi:hypothetical protein